MLLVETTDSKMFIFQLTRFHIKLRQCEVGLLWRTDRRQPKSQVDEISVKSLGGISNPLLDG